MKPVISDEMQGFEQRVFGKFSCTLIANGIGTAVLTVVLLQLFS
jgi:hypothetical protein